MRKLTAPLKNISLTIRGAANEKVYAIAAFCNAYLYKSLFNDDLSS